MSDESPRHKITIEKINLRDDISINPKKINVFIGANHCGKTGLLKDILNYITGKNPPFTIIKNLEMIYPKDLAELSAKYGMTLFNEIMTLIICCCKLINALF